MAYRGCERVVLNPNDLVITREDLDERKIASMVAGLLAGTLFPEELTIPMVTPIVGGGYMVGDGNHSVTAMKRAHITQIECEVYKIRH